MARVSPAVRAYVGLGANLGDPMRQIEQAIDAIGGLSATRVRRVSSFYRTAPWGPIAQDAFINAVAEIDTELPALELMLGLLSVEQQLGRCRGERYGPRHIDLDLLMYAERQVDLPGCRVPHPRMTERAFVLVPLAEMAPDALIPGSGPVRAALAALPFGEIAGVERLAAGGERRVASGS